MSDTARNSLPLSFDILERFDGGAIQLIFSGDPDSTVSVSGTIVGAGSPRALKRGEQGFTKSRTPRERARALKSPAYGMLGFGAAFLLFGLHRARQRRLAGRSPWVSAGIAAGALLYVATGVYFAYQVHQTESPGVPAAIWTSLAGRPALRALAEAGLFARRGEDRTSNVSTCRQSTKSR